MSSKFSLVTSACVLQEKLLKMEKTLWKELQILEVDIVIFNVFQYVSWIIQNALMSMTSGGCKVGWCPSTSMYTINLRGNLLPVKLSSHCNLVNVWSVAKWLSIRWWRLVRVFIHVFECRPLTPYIHFLPIWRHLFVKCSQAFPFSKHSCSSVHYAECKPKTKNSVKSGEPGYFLAKMKITGWAAIHLTYLISN